MQGSLLAQRLFTTLGSASRLRASLLAFAPFDSQLWPSLFFERPSDCRGALVGLGCSQTGSHVLDAFLVSPAVAQDDKAVLASQLTVRPGD